MYTTCISHLHNANDFLLALAGHVRCTGKNVDMFSLKPLG